MGSDPNAAGERFTLCYESPQDNVARYNLYPEPRPREDVLAGARRWILRNREG